VVVRTLILSDLHLGSGGDIDLLRRPELRETLWAEVDGVDEVVLLGDAVELRDRPLAEALELAGTALELGSATAPKGRAGAGNDDHHSPGLIALAPEERPPGWTAGPGAVGACPAGRGMDERR
jgi:hypothetical protein